MKTLYFKEYDFPLDSQEIMQIARKYSEDVNGRSAVSVKDFDTVADAARIFRAMTECGWTVSVSENGVDLEGWSPKNENITLYLPSSDTANILADITRVLEDYDPEEHAGEWIAARREDLDSCVLSVAELVKDAEAIGDMYSDLQAAVAAALKKKPLPERIRPEVRKIAGFARFLDDFSDRELANLVASLNMTESNTIKSYASIDLLVKLLDASDELLKARAEAVETGSRKAVELELADMLNKWLEKRRSTDTGKMSTKDLADEVVRSMS